jgi:hypothetical protein
MGRSDTLSRCWAVGKGACLMGVDMSAAIPERTSIYSSQIFLSSSGNFEPRGRKKSTYVSEGVAPEGSLHNSIRR